MWGKSLNFILCLAFCLFGWERVGGDMEFDLILFTLAPSTEQFDRFRKDDFFKIAEFFKIEIPRKASKKAIKTLLYKELVQQQILPEESGLESVEEGAAALAEADEKPSPVLLSPVRPSDPLFVRQSTPVAVATSVTDY